jgi:hypothetical protein
MKKINKRIQEIVYEIYYVLIKDLNLCFFPKGIESNDLKTKILF